MRKPVLLDRIIKPGSRMGDTQTEVNGKWYIAKPLPYYGWTTIPERFYHALLVLFNKAFAVQFAEDYFKTRSPKK